MLTEGRSCASEGAVWDSGRHFDVQQLIHAGGCISVGRSRLAEVCCWQVPGCSCYTCRDAGR